MGRLKGDGLGGFVPRDASSVCSKRYGDCKDKAVIVTAMMREAGFEAWVGLLRSGTSTDINPLLPSLNGFNHAIVFIGGVRRIGKFSRRCF